MMPLTYRPLRPARKVRDPLPGHTLRRALGGRDRVTLGGSPGNLAGGIFRQWQQRERRIKVKEEEEQGRQEEWHGDDAVTARDFNTIQIIGDEIIKPSRSENITGELCAMENRRGLTFSHMLVGRSITSGHLFHLLGVCDHVLFTSANGGHHHDSPSGAALLDPIVDEETYSARIRRKTLVRLTAASLLFFSLVPLHRKELHLVFLRERHLGQRPRALG
ncbi:hypothetical protein MKZ38_000458 [Zalerion maritima]|uniref:Uncharacterized protein n=1 Tax=Zalerion maritima TaxID=339359 RepID=A0AAD5WX79_9PEZI|nr:hypothetical protein MKZ38_000458 [Zalerion maritima]